MQDFWNSTGWLDAEIMLDPPSYILCSIFPDISLLPPQSLMFLVHCSRNLWPSNPVFAHQMCHTPPSKWSLTLNFSDLEQIISSWKQNYRYDLAAIATRQLFLAVTVMILQNRQSVPWKFYLSPPHFRRNGRHRSSFSCTTAPTAITWLLRKTSNAACISFLHQRILLIQVSIAHI